MLAVRNDAELNTILQEVVIPDGGVLPHIHSALVPKRSGQAPVSQVEKKEGNDAASQEIL